MKTSTTTLAGLCAAGLLAGCQDERLTGTNNETHTKATFYQSSGRPASGARVRVFAASQSLTDSLPVAQAIVDPNGQVSLKLKPGYFSLLADDTSGRAVFIDSVLSDGDTLMIPADTLRPTGSFTGRVRVQPMHSPAVSWIHIRRTNLFANVDSAGNFRLDGVPAGRMDLVALSHLKEYTPTYRFPRAISDSAVDVGTIDLVYNGLPLATGLAARYDSLSGVVTVSWHDTTFARKDRWVVFRGQGDDLPDQSVGTSPTGGFSDTIFAAMGHHGSYSIMDSVAMDLTYWVAARSKDTTTGPVWNKVTVRVVSPALAKRWTLGWSRPLAVTGIANPQNSRLDTLASGLVLSQRIDKSDASSEFLLRILGSDGAWTSAAIPTIEEMETDPVFWQGKIWLAKGKASSRHFEDTAMGGLTAVSTPVFDSVEIRSSGDGITWQSTTLALPLDSITSFRLNATASEIVLAPCYRRANQVVGSLSYSKALIGSANGIQWSSRPIDSVLTGQDGRPFVAGFWNAAVRPVGPNATWTILNDTWVIPSLSVATSQAIFLAGGWTNGEKAMVAGNGSHLAISTGKRLLLSQGGNSYSWQHVSAPEPVNAICFWQGKLVVLGQTGLHLGTIDKAP